MLRKASLHSREMPAPLSRSTKVLHVPNAEKQDIQQLTASRIWPLSPRGSPDLWMTSKSHSEITYLKIEENEIFEIFCILWIFSFLHIAAPINFFLFQMIKPIANFHNKEFKGIVKASSRLTKLWNTTSGPIFSSEEILFQHVHLSYKSGNSIPSTFRSSSSSY